MKTKFQNKDIVWYLDKNVYESKIEPVIVKYFNSKFGWWSVARLYFRDSRIINGTPIQDFETTEWMDIPKDWKKEHKNEIWSASRGLYDVSYEDWSHLPKLDTIDFKDKNTLQKLIDYNIYVVGYDKIDWHIDVEIDKPCKKYRIVKSIPAWSITYGDKPKQFSTNGIDLFETYDEAEKAKQEWETELEIERNLSDYDWSVKEMDKVLKMFHDDDFAERCMAKLLSMDRVEDIEIKKSDNKVLWRYFMTPLDNGYKDNKWKVLEV